MAVTSLSASTSELSFTTEQRAVNEMSSDNRLQDTLFLQSVLHQLRDANQPLKKRYQLMNWVRRLKTPTQP
ncbi:hypothetical protein [Gallaecimonas mangrovi]|uniref:hypothetical protein n=1 Tax=Gallaecimonas mangrovi TaxID=2291597 RepID=UPI000E2093BD|nr:hypothetical protein [Gallaecimonas mangrovi]